MQPIKKTRGDSLGYDEGDFLKLTLSVMEQVGKSPEVHITAHPDNNFDLLDQGGIKLTEGRGIEDIKNAHTILGMFSMQMVVGYLWGRKIASVQPKLKGIDPFPLSRWGLVPKIENKKELIKFMNLAVDGSISEKILLLQQLNGSLNRLDRFVRKE